MLNEAIYYDDSNRNPPRRQLERLFLLPTAKAIAIVPPTFEHDDIGFRVASVPEPGSLIMLLGFAGIALLYDC